MKRQLKYKTNKSIVSLHSVDILCRMLWSCVPDQTGCANVSATLWAVLLFLLLLVLLLLLALFFVVVSFLFLVFLFVRLNHIRGL